MESFPPIKLQSVAGWEYACLGQKTVVEGYFLSYKGKLLKKLEIFFIPDPAINAQKTLAFTQGPTLLSDMETRM